MVKKSISKKKSSWAVKWYANAYLNNSLTLYTHHSSVKNIENDDSGSHAANNFHYNTRLKNKPIRINNLKIAELPESRKIFENFFNTNQKILYKFKKPSK